MRGIKSEVLQRLVVSNKQRCTAVYIKRNKIKNVIKYYVSTGKCLREESLHKSYRI